MRRLAQAFTLVELLVVLAIVSTLAAILFPLMSGARASALRGACISNLRQITAATNLYAGDYDDTFMPTSYRPGEAADSRTDRTWVQILLPYIRNFSVFKCPADESPRPKAESSFDSDLVPGDADSRYYTASMRTNYGYNYQYLSPSLRMDDQWVAQPRSLTMVAAPSDTILFVDSVWSRSPSGAPHGGGSWLVTPPCRYIVTASGVRMDSFTGGTRPVPVFTTSIGWSAWASAATIYGNAWPWHSGRMNVARIDGSVRSIDTAQLSAGCELRQGWQGSIKDPGRYIWDLQ